MITHPLSIGLTLLAQVILVAIVTGTLSTNFWFSYILFIIIVGGMLVLFIYITRIASNEKFSFSIKFYLISITLLTLSLLIRLTERFPKWIKSINNDIIIKISNPIFELSLRKYFISTSIIIIIILIVYLLITLIAVVKITNIKYGPLRKIS